MKRPISHSTMTLFLAPGAPTEEHPHVQMPGGYVTIGDMEGARVAVHVETADDARRICKAFFRLARMLGEAEGREAEIDALAAAEGLPWDVAQARLQKESEATEPREVVHG